MKSLRYFVAAVTLLACAAVAASGLDAKTSFAAVKSLTGSWEGKTADGKPVKVSYRVTAGGSAVMSEIMGDEDMITMFHLDGERLLMTHYCGAGNQPRMVATASPDGKVLTFDFVDGTNLDSAHPGHMQRLVLTMVDDNHHTEEWDFGGGGKEMKEVFELQRSK